MKTIKFPLIVVVALAAVFSFAACSDDDDVDNTKPVIRLNNPAEGEIIKIGSFIDFDAVFADDVELKSYKVDIHSNFNDHGHTKSASADETVPFSIKKSWNLPAQKDATIHQHEIVIPANATPGKYHLMIYCVDAAGNESYVARNIVLSLDGEEHEHD